MKALKVRPSLLSADFGNLERTLASVSTCADGLHCDVMDGHFVPNITFGPILIEAAHRITKLPLNAHLMIENPDDYIPEFAKAGASEIIVHAEASVHLHRTIQYIKGCGVSAGVALNPSTPICVLENVVNDISSILIMTVNPGFGGQNFIETMLPKIAATRRMADEAGADLDIAVDGGINPQTTPKVVAAGANVLVAGSFIFSEDMSPHEACEILRRAAQEAIPV